MRWSEPRSRLIVDTHTLIWNAEGPDFPGYRLSERAMEAIDEADEVLVSHASLWELAIKSALPGPRALRLSRPYDEWIDVVLSRSGFAPLAIHGSHLKRVAALPPYHGDPFDRLLVAQSLAEGLPIVSADAALDPYGVERIW